MVYDYKTAVKTDIEDSLEDHNFIDYGVNFDDVFAALESELWTADSVTGNGSGSYTFNRTEAGEYVKEDGADYIRDMIKDGWIDANTATDKFINEDWEYFDVSIRCYLLDECLYKVLRDQWPNKIMDGDYVVCLDLEDDGGDDSNLGVTA